MQELEVLLADTRQMRLQRQCRRRNDRHRAFALQLDTARRNGDLGYLRVIVEHKKTSEGAVLPEDVRPISVSARHGTDVKVDQLDKDLISTR